MEEETKTGVQLEDLGRLLLVLGDNLPGQGGHHVQDVIVELLRESGNLNPCLKSSMSRHTLGRFIFHKITDVVLSICNILLSNISRLVQKSDYLDHF